MKKSKIIQNSKDMLSRSFNPAKCKTALKLATSRSKLSRNKKEIQVKQMKREIAMLLESGQDRTARIRVEHVIREEKMVAAYELLEIYCELIVARLPIIESQKTCPVDLKEAIASVVFASPRCGDVPELVDVKKQFTAKYGKDFTSAANELRPQCGVSRLLVEKLSAVSPDGQTKNKILTMIAKEHNVEWDPLSPDVKDFAHLDLQSDMSTSRKEGAAVVQDHLSNSNVHVLPSHHDFRPPMGSNKYARDDIKAESSQEGSSKNFPDMRKWSFEFKDAASAAQAAAESAELASMAARAAAELSSQDRIMNASSTKSHKSGVHTPGHEGGPEMYRYSTITSEKSSEEFGSANRSTSEYAGPWNDSKTRRFSNDSATEDNKDASTFSDSVGQEQDHSHKSPEEAPKYGPDVSHVDRISKLQSASSSHSLASSSADENIFASYDDDLKVTSKDPFRYAGDGGGIHDEASAVSSVEHAGGVFIDRFDDSDGDDNDSDLGPTYDDHDQELDSPSPQLQNLSEKVSLAESTSAQLFTRNNTSKDGDSAAPATFDDSDGLGSEGEENVSHFFESKFDSKSVWSEDERHSETDDGLNFGKLTGGFRHKSNKGLSFFRSQNQLGVSSSMVEMKNERSEATTRFDSRPDVDTSSTLVDQKRRQSKSTLYSSEEEEEVVRDDYFGAANEMKSIFEAPKNPKMGSDGDPPKGSLRSHLLQSGVSRRTKPSSYGYHSLGSSEPNYEQPLPKNISSSSSQKTSSDDNKTPKKTTASHVHPKLPDYDAIVQSLRRSSS